MRRPAVRGCEGHLPAPGPDLGWLALAPAAPSSQGFVPLWLGLVLLGVAAVVGGAFVVEPLAALRRLVARRADSASPEDEIGQAPSPPRAAAPGTDLATATVQQLAELPGIGKVLAGRIVDWRAAHGPVVRAEDLLSVAGIGAHRCRVLRDASRLE